MYCTLKIDINNSLKWVNNMSKIMIIKWNNTDLYLKKGDKEANLTFPIYYTQISSAVIEF